MCYQVSCNRSKNEDDSTHGWCSMLDVVTAWAIITNYLAVTLAGQRTD
jgi:hypothetical protein